MLNEKDTLVEVQILAERMEFYIAQFENFELDEIHNDSKTCNYYLMFLNQLEELNKQMLQLLN